MGSAAAFSVSAAGLAEDRPILQRKSNPEATDFSEGISYNAVHRGLQEKYGTVLSAECIVLSVLLRIPIWFK